MVRGYDPASDGPLWDAVFDPALEEGLFWRTARQVRDVRALFVTRLGWTRDALSRYRFRACAEVARDDREPVLVRLRTNAQAAELQGRAHLEQTLRAFTDAPMTRWSDLSRLHLQPHPLVEDIVKKYPVTLSQAEYDMIRAAAAVVGETVSSRDADHGNRDLSRAIVALIRRAYAR